MRRKYWPTAERTTVGGIADAACEVAAAQMTFGLQMMGPMAERRLSLEHRQPMMRVPIHGQPFSQ